MHAKPDLRVVLKWTIAGSGSVIADVIRLPKTNHKDCFSGKVMKHKGKPPKSSGQIRTKLESISETAGVVRPSGPANDGAQGSRQFVVASFFDHQLGRQFQRELTRSELFSESVVSARKLVISVDYADVQIASAISEKFRNKYPDRQDQLASNRYDYMIFGIVVGVSISMIFIAGAKDPMANAAFCLASSGFFGASGHLVDRVANPKTALGLWDLFVLVAIIGTAISAFNGLPALLN